MIGPRLRQAIETALDDAVATSRPLGGGDVAESHRVEMVSGRTVFAKTHRAPPPDFFETEAEGLRWLGVPDAIPVPRVLAAGPDHLVLEWVEPGAPEATTDERFGEALAELHLAGADTFGRTDGRTTGSRRLPNDPCDTWEEHFAVNRLRPLAERWRQTPSLPRSTADGLDLVAERLPTLGVPAEPPARLHGDLWAGNRLVDVRGESWLVDPAAHGGHREFDLAMMLLFGGFGPQAFAAYHRRHPLAPGWRLRVPLHQLAPLAVHAIKFGGGYVDATERALADVADLATTERSGLS